MGVGCFDDLMKHVGHKIVCATYGNTEVGVVNVAVECLDCYEVLLDFDREESHD